MRFCWLQGMLIFIVVWLSCIRSLDVRCHEWLTTALSYLFTLVITDAVTIALSTSDAGVLSTGQSDEAVSLSPISPNTAVHRCVEANADNGNIDSR